MRARLSRVAPLVSVLAACVVGFWYSPVTLGITDLDEGLYAACAREMARTADWVTPRVNGEPFYEKPPLLYWLSAISIRLLGPTERAVRLPSAVSATLLVLLTYAVGLRFMGRPAAIVAASGLALAPMAVAAGRLATTDATLCLLITGSLFSAYLATVDPPERRRFWSLLAWACAGLGTLAKGAPAFVLPIVIVGAYHLIAKRTSPAVLLRRLLSADTVVGLAIFVAIVAPWHIAAWRANGQPFVDEYILRQHVGRFRGGDTAHHAPLWFFVPAFLAGFFPWSVFTLPALYPRRRDARPAEVRPHADPEGSALSSHPSALSFCHFLRIWFAAVFIIFSVGGSKLVSYILPLYPAAALLAGDWLARASRQSVHGRPILVAGLLGAAIVGMLFLCLLVPAPVVALINRYADRPVALDSIDADLLRLASYMAGTLAAGLLAIAAMAAVRRLHLIPHALSMTMVVFLLIALHTGVPAAQARIVGSLHETVRRAATLVGDTGTLIIALPGARRPSVLYYVPDSLLARRAVIEVDPDDAGGRAAAPAWVEAHARAHGPTIALVRADDPLAAQLSDHDAVAYRDSIFAIVMLGRRDSTAMPARER